MNKQLLRLFIISSFVIFIFGCNKTNVIEEEPNEVEQTSKKETEQNDIEKDFDRNEEQVEKETELDKQTPEEPSIAEQINIRSDSSITALINKHNSLSDDYEPEDLVLVDVPIVYESKEANSLREEAAQALEEMFADAKQEGHILYARSGYRSYNTQVILFDQYVARDGEEAANKYSAKPGYSEHQTGLVMDVTAESVQFDLVEEFAHTEEGKWVKHNAHKYGFIIRYPEGKENITGYIFEPWHLRYLGKELAEALYVSGLTYEEFLMEEEMIPVFNATIK